MQGRWRRLYANVDIVRIEQDRGWAVNHEKPDRMRRRLLAATAFLVGSGGVAALYPIVANWKPLESSEAMSTLEVDIAHLLPGGMLTVAWSGKPVWIIWRTPEMLRLLAGLSESVIVADVSPDRLFISEDSIRRPEIAVLVGECTHLGCIPLPKLRAGAVEGMSPDWPGGFVCPCHGATFDLAGRVFRNTLAPTRLRVPPYVYLSENRIRIGTEGNVT